MTARPAEARPTVYQWWSQSLVGMLVWEMQLFETQYQVGLKIVEAAMRMPSRWAVSPGEQVCTCVQTTDDLPTLETLAIERTRKGLAPPREIYEVSHRDRIDWSKFPEWARPIDSELFQESGHEG